MASEYLRERLYEFLSDGRWVPREEVIRFVSSIVPPAVALRERQERVAYRRQKYLADNRGIRQQREGARDPDVARQIAVGQRYIAYRYVYNWIQVRILETIEYQGKPWVRLLRPPQGSSPRKLEGS